MKEKDCKIVQDLLPNYIENLTSEETNNYIKQHLEKCEECRKIYENMKKELKIDNKEKNKKEAKYFKKYKNRLQILKIIILIIVILFVIFVGRKIIIISDLSNKANIYASYTNYHVTTYSADREKYMITEKFIMNDKIKLITTNLSTEGNKVTTIYATKINNDKYNVNIYEQTADGIKTTLDKEIMISVSIQNILYTENWWQLLIYSIPASITTKTYNGEECYYIANFNNPYTNSPEGIYISKETGLPISTVGYEVNYEDGTKGRWPAVEYVYEFGSVTQNDFIEPSSN